jgi:hypothetical protein
MRGFRGARVFLAAVAVACSTDATNPSTPASQLDAARALWDRVGPARYTFEAHRVCECLADAVGPVRVRVENGAVVSVVRVDSEVAVDPGLWFDIEELFGLIETELAQRPSLLEAGYDADDGHPVEVAYGERDVDAGAVIRITSLTPLTTVVPPYYQRTR